MVEYYPCFERDDEEVIGGDYLDFALLDRDIINQVLQKNGFKPIVEYFGLIPEQNDILNENAPPHLRNAWDDDMYNWSKPEVGLHISKTIRDALKNQPAMFEEWPGMLQDVDEVITIAERVFTRAVERQVRWHLSCPGF